MMDKIKPEEEVQYLHFSLGENFGQLITDIAREKAWYDCHESAGILMLIEGVGVSPDEARAVVHGKMKLVTNKDKKTVHLTEDNWTPPDFKKMREKISKAITKAQEIIEIDGWQKDRLILSEKEKLQVQIEIKDIKELTEMNIWKGHQRAIDLERWMLDIHNQNRERLREIYADIKKKKKQIKKFEKETVPNIMEEVKQNAIEHIEMSNLLPENKERMKRLVNNTDKVVDEIKEDPTFESDTGWLDREGHYWGCELGLHIQLAERLAELFFPITVTAEDASHPHINRNAERKLEEEGWMKCTGRIWYETEKKPTHAQMRTFDKWCQKWEVHKYHAKGDY